MATNGIVRRVDELGRFVIPKEIRRNMGLNDGDPLEVTYNNNTISIRKYKRSFEQCAIDWYSTHIYEMNNCYFHVRDDYTFCIVRLPHTPSRGGYAKRHETDTWDNRIGKVASYARAMGKNLNKMIGYEG